MLSQVASSVISQMTPGAAEEKAILKVTVQTKQASITNGHNLHLWHLAPRVPLKNPSQQTPRLCLQRSPPEAFHEQSKVQESK